MKRLFLLAITAGLLLLPIAADAGYSSESAATPPISQALVREGDYAVRLVTALNIGSVEDETQAEDILAAASVAPDSGWISDFPVTPDIIAEIQASIDSAADAGKLPMGREDAERAFLALNAEIGLSITPSASAEPANEPAAYSEPDVINNYYYDEGPPVITYYAPPPDFLYLYAWDPFPFWCDGFFFPGFFVLTDFNFVFIDRDDFRFHRHHHDGFFGHNITNHIVDPVSKGSVVIDPVSRHPLTKTAFKPVGARGTFDAVIRTGGAHNTARVIGSVKGGSFNRKSAASLLGQSVNRQAAGAGARSRDRSAARYASQWVRTDSTPSRVTPSWSRNVNAGAQRSFNRPSSGFSRSSGDRLQGAPAMRSTNQSAEVHGRSFGAPSAGGRGRMSEIGRSFGEVGGGRSFSAPSGGGRSFSASGGGRSSGGGGFGGMRGGR